MSTKADETNLDEGVLNNSEWVQRWADGDVGFHQDKHDPILDTKEDDIFGGKTKSVFLPLCGKSVDILWLYNHGHTVCGVEIAEAAVEDFFRESNIEYICEEVKNVGNAYKSRDGRICLYASDLFDISPELCGKFDVIWDSKSFVAINKCDRSQYINLLLSLMKKDGVYYLSTIDYDPSVWPGPPHPVSDQIVQTSYGDRCDIVTVDEVYLQPKSTSEESSTHMPKSDKAVTAIRQSSFMRFKWYKITLRNQRNA